MPKYGKQRGAETELMACAWLLGQGYEVFRNVSPFGMIDIIAIKDGVTRYIDAKSHAGGNLHGTLEQTENVEILYRLPNGEFKFRKKRSKFIIRDKTPREVVLEKIKGLERDRIDGGC